MSSSTDQHQVKGISAAEALSTSSLPHLVRSDLCFDYLEGFCRHGDRCRYSHTLCDIENDSDHQETSVVGSIPNVLSQDPRRSRFDKNDFEIDGPGHLSANPRHDNDIANISQIKILPTADEILCLRRPYMPVKDYASHAPEGIKRLTDMHFRHLRYDSTESIIDICYHAIQTLVSLGADLKRANYDDRMQTPQGNRYSLFRDVDFVEAQFDEINSLCFRVSFACPKPLRGDGLFKSGCLQQGMMAALIGFDAVKSKVSVTFVEIFRRESTNAMRMKTKNDLKASCVINLAEPGDLSAARRLLLNKQGSLSEQFILVDMPSVLLPGFSWCLKRLQMIWLSEEEMAFSPLIAGNSITDGSNEPPKYKEGEDLTYDLRVLRNQDNAQREDTLTLRPRNHFHNQQAQQPILNALRHETTLDDGQAKALCETLSRGLAFTQGPPGTGKTFLGVALTKALLASRDTTGAKPILVVCMTNHALDSFLDDLRKDGIDKLVRLGGGSKEQWIEKFRPRAIAQRVKGLPSSNKAYGRIKYQSEGLTFLGAGLCSSLNSGLMSWSAIRDHLEEHHKSAFRAFADLEYVESHHQFSEIRAARQAGGFAFEFWCAGGDLKDIDSLLNSFDGMLGKNEVYDCTMDPDKQSRARDAVITQVLHNAQQISGTQESDIWAMPHTGRLDLVKNWREEAGRALLVDQIVEIHRRHQAAQHRLHQCRIDGDVHRFSQQDVIGLTTTACAKFWPLLSKLDLQTVICEEAGEVIEAHTLCTLFPSIVHAIFIGDPLQLRAQVNEKEMAVENGKRYRLDQSLFERLMLPSLPELKPFPTSRLDIQRRAHPTIANLMRATLYPDLKDEPSTHKHPKVAGMTERLWWLDHRHVEERPDPKSKFSTSFVNSFEVEMIFGLVQYLVQTNEYNFGDIAVLTPYNGQLEALSDRLRGTCSIWLIEKDKETLKELTDTDDPENSIFEDTNGKTTFDMSNMLRLATIDNFQGEEAKIVILSTVRSNFDRRVGFLKTANRINVACSRAKHGFFILGDASLMQTNNKWDPIIKHLTQKGKIGPSFHACCSRHPQSVYEIRTPEDFAKVPICDLTCSGILPCGHICKDKCHPRSLHQRMLCTYPCPRRHRNCGHACPKLCWEPCGDCNEKTALTALDCGHTQMMTCKEVQSGISPACHTIIETVELRCGHYFDRKCGSYDEVPLCEQPCSTILSCGHQCSDLCSKCRSQGSHSLCNGECGQVGDCGHSCPLPCHPGPCPPCEVICQKACSHVRFQHKCSRISDLCMKPCTQLPGCTSLCCLPCTRTASNNPCQRFLECGHICSSLEDERCPEKCIQCDTGAFPNYLQVYLPCTHTVNIKTLDEHLNASTMYRITDTGVIERPNASAIHQMQDALGCPQCGQPIQEIRRYSGAFKLHNISSTLDEVYVMFGQELKYFMRQTYYIRQDLRHVLERNAFIRRLAPGPLGGRTNETLVRLRGTKTNELQTKIIAFRDESIIPFEESISAINDFVGEDDLAALLRSKQNSPAGSSDSSTSAQRPLSPTGPLDQNLQVDKPRNLQTIQTVQDEGYESDEEVIIGNLPDTAIVRELLRQAEDRKIAQRGNSSWHVSRQLRPFISALKKVPASEAITGDFSVANLPFKLRLESVYYRCRLLILEDAIFMLGELKRLEPSTHTHMLLQGLRYKTIGHAEDIMLHLGNAIASCAIKHLKRLEVELRLIQVSFHAVLAALGQDSGIDIRASIQVMLDLCAQYPDTAGLFLKSCKTVKRAVESGSREWNIELYNKDANEFWKKWAGHEVGYLRHCVNGHPYSGYVFTDCPECGRYVELVKAKEENTVSAASFLKEGDFVAHMKTLKKGTKWVGKLRQEQAVGGS